MSSKEQVDRLKRLPADKRRLLLSNLKSRRINGEALVAEGLKQCGVKYLNGLPGTPVCDVFTEARKRGIRILCTRHQFTGTMMAAAHNFITGKVVHSVCLSAGPGVTNATTGILHAYRNNWPLLVLGSRRALTGEGSGYFQELDAVPIMESITKWAATARNVSEIMPMIAKACKIAMKGTPGPTFLDLPEDALIDFGLPEQVDSECSYSPLQPNPDEVAMFLDRLRQSSSPLLCLGEELLPRFNQKPILDLVERENLPFITTSMARGILPENHPLCLNKVRRKAMLSTDLFVLAGAWFDWRLRLGECCNPGTPIIHIHPSMDLLGKNVPDATCYQADPMVFLESILKTRASRAIPDLDSRIDRFPRNQCPEPASNAILNEGYANSVRAMQILNEEKAGNAFIAADASIHLGIAQHYIEINEPLSWMDPGWHGLIGCGIPTALGNKLATPDRPVIAVIGDTSFGMAGMELETAVRHNIPIKVMVMNNSGIVGSHREKLTVPPDHPERFCQFSPDLQYDKIALALGADAEAVSSNEDLRPAIRRMLTSERPYCLNVLVHPATPAPPPW
jgi:thiamine pyrophosphate-dependent acetolactate synthase large subunit-like protein